MKLTKKLMAIVMVIAIMVSMTVTAFAASDTDITITGAISGATYNGYRLLDTTTSLKVQGCHDTDAEHLSTCYNVAYSVNDKYYDILKTETGKTTDTEIIKYISELTTAEAIREFADDIYAAITSGAFDFDATATGGENLTAVLNGVDSGYWIIVETISDENYDGAYSLVMLDTAGSRDITVATKRDEPSLIKHVRDNGMSYGHGADVQIGDDAEFLLLTDVPNPIGYSTYTYLIHDQMEKGLTFNSDSVEIRLNSVDGTVLDDTYYTVTPTPQCNSGCSFHISVDIKTATAAGILKGDDRLYVTYTAKLNEGANILVNGTDTANANKNTAWLEYSNDPYNAAKTATSTHMDVYVWTFPLELNKVDSARVSLPGAKFVLSRSNNLTEENLKHNENGDLVTTADLIPLIAVENAANTYRIAPNGYTGAVVYEIEAGTAKLQGFDDQVEYYLYETQAPDGYNKLSAPVSVKFFAQYESSESPLFAAGFPKVSINTAAESSELKAEVVNQTGAELPSTGGIGTTIFYIAGGLLVVAAIVLLITRKRMSTES